MSLINEGGRGGHHRGLRVTLGVDAMGSDSTATRESAVGLVSSPQVSASLLSLFACASRRA